MTNPYYNYSSGVPVAVTRGTSVSLRTEFGLVGAGFDSVNGALNMLAPIASPVFTGTPSGPTAAPGTNTTQLATTSFVVSSYASIANPTFTGVVTIPSGANIAGYALLTSPAFSGTPSAPTATPGTSTTQLATTAFVMTQAFASVLPAQAGNAGKFVTTDGTTASWASAQPTVAIVSATAQTAVAGSEYVLTNVAATTVTLPSTPAPNDKVIVKVANGLTANVINPNGNTIEGVAGNMTIDSAYAVVNLQYLNGSWRFV